MRYSALLLLVIASACGQAPPPARRADARGMQTLESADARPAVVDPPPVLLDEAPAIKLRDAVAAANLVPLTPADEQLRAKMPFAPAIAMDPVDGSKISIRATTPTVEVKGKIYYFSSEKSKQAFLADPDQYMKGLFSHL